jgi:Family of unknown function (DUF5694)
MKTLNVLICIFFAQFVLAQKSEVLLVGTFHFNNPGFDVAKTKTFDIMSDKAQKELEYISNKIKSYGPEKIFVEWEFDHQAGLDTLYDMYLKGEYFDYVAKKYPKKTFYIQNEIIQLAFRIGKKAGLKKIYAIDYQYAGDFPYDSLMKEVENAKQYSLKQEIENITKTYVDSKNKEFEILSLSQILLNANTTVKRKSDIGGYITQFNRAARKDNFVGAYLNSEWYKRNLFMYAIVQKNIESKDKKAMILAGASHVAMFKEFISLDSKLKAVELSEVLSKK